MLTVVHLKWGERPPVADRYLLVTRQGRIRGEDFYVRTSDGFSDAAAEEARAFASLASALKMAESVAERCGVETIYIRLN